MYSELILASGKLREVTIKTQKKEQNNEKRGESKGQQTKKRELRQTSCLQQKEITKS